MAKRHATEEDVMEFIRAVYPDAPELATASSDEKTCLHDAVLLIAVLRHELAEAAKEIQGLKSALRGAERRNASV